jgi:peroxiredoxin
LAAFGARVAGVSSQPLAEQQEFAARTRMPFPIVSDQEFILAATLSFPTFEFNEGRFYKRLTLIAEQGIIAKVFYPVFPPDRNAIDVLNWLTRHRSGEPG